ncbi:MAG: class I SAM-dependent methyltransferase [Mycobacterium sp.]
MNKDHLELLVTDYWREKLRDVIMPNALNGIPLGYDVLEVGSGPGMTTDLLRIEVAHLTAVELDAGLAAQLTSRLAGTNVEVVHADAAAMPFHGGRFTSVVSFTMLHHIPTVHLQDRVFAEVARVLRPGGVFVAADSCASEELAALHVDDIYNPVEPASVADRLAAAGFAEARVQVHEGHWTVLARKPEQHTGGAG